MINLRRVCIFTSVIILPVQANAAIIDVAAADLKAAFATVQAGDTLRVFGSVGSIALLNRNFSTRVTIDATNAVFTDTLTIKGVNNLTMLGGSFGSATVPLRSGSAIAASESSNLMFSKNKFIGDGTRAGLSLAAVSKTTVTAANFSNLRLGLGVTSSSDVRLSSNRFSAMTSDGINIVDSKRVTATANNCSKFAPSLNSHPDCIQLWSIAGNPVQSDITLTNNIVNGPTQGITSFNPDNGGGLRIKMIGNTVSTSYPQGIACYNCVDSVFTDNILSTLPGSQWRTSMNIVGGSNNLIANNTIGEKPLSMGMQENVALGEPGEGSFDDPRAFDEPLPDFVLEYLASLNGAVPGNAFSVDGEPLAALSDARFGSLSISAVPEPLIWAQLIVGFGLVGAMARHRKAAKA